jgi:hypothetical protein
MRKQHRNANCKTGTPLRTSIISFQVLIPGSVAQTILWLRCQQDERCSANEIRVEAREMCRVRGDEQV